MAIFPKQGGAEGVDGADGRLIALVLLAAEASVGRICRGGLCNGIHNAAAHLARSRAGIGDYKEAVNVLVFKRVGDIAEHSLREDAGLSAARRRAHKKAASAGLNGTLLTFGE